MRTAVSCLTICSTLISTAVGATGNRSWDCTEETAFTGVFSKKKDVELKDGIWTHLPRRLSIIEPETVKITISEVSERVNSTHGNYNILIESTSGIYTRKYYCYRDKTNANDIYPRCKTSSSGDFFFDPVSYFYREIENPNDLGPLVGIFPEADYLTHQSVGMGYCEER